VLKVKEHGLTCAVLGGANIEIGLNREAHQPKILAELRERIDSPPATGVPNVICMSGNRTIKGQTISDDEGWTSAPRA